MHTGVRVQDSVWICTYALRENVFELKHHFLRKGRRPMLLINFCFVHHAIFFIAVILFLNYLTSLLSVSRAAILHKSR
jgi:hypothetical protein